LAAQLSRPNRITFTKINVDHQQDIAKAYGVTAYHAHIHRLRARPSNLHCQRRRPQEAVRSGAQTRLRGQQARRRRRRGLVRRLRCRLDRAAAPKGYADITDQYDPKGLELLNRDSEFGTAKTLFETSKPSALNNGKGTAKDWVESDTDEQLMLFVPFQSTLKVHSLQITSLPPSDGDDDDEVPMRPQTIRLYTNRAHVLGFDEADDIDPAQTVTIQPEDWDKKTGTVKIDLRFVRFQRVTSLVMFFVDGDGDNDKLRVDRIRIFGEAGEKREMGKLEKIGDEPGE
ncbi:thioredoxin, partial [Aspergillus nomiae NRRL 13137]